MSHEYIHCSVTGKDTTLEKGMFKSMKSFIDPLDASVEKIDELIEVAEDIIANPDRYSEACRRKKLATLFFEPSTRTRLSFEAAMMELGGNVIGFAGADSTSASKGESVSDTIKMINCYADIIAMRHPKEGSALVAAQNSTIPVINAGDGGHQHPTQTLTDLFTIKKLRGDLSNITIGLCGDLKFGRTVHSLIRAMVRYDNVKFVLCSPDELKLPRYIKDEIVGHGHEYCQFSLLEDCIDELDVLYMTRVQRERFFNEEEYLRLKDFYILDPYKMTLAKDDMMVMHPLPRVNEISAEIDSDPRAKYFEQALYGKYIRMALILDMLKITV